MTKVKYVGRPSLTFYGKYLSEIASNLYNCGIGRVVIKGSEKMMYTEPCFYVIKSISPLMSDSSGVRCRALAERVFRGFNFGIAPVPKSHEPDWNLLSIEEGDKLQKSTALNPNVPPRVPMKCVFPMPPVLAIKLRNMGKIPRDIVEAASRAAFEERSATIREGSGYLLLAKISADPTLFQVPVEPTEEEKHRIFPDYWVQKAFSSGLTRKATAERANERNVYYIRRGDTPGLRWRVELADADVEDELIRLPLPLSSSPHRPSSSVYKFADSSDLSEQSKPV